MHHVLVFLPRLPFVRTPLLFYHTHRLLLVYYGFYTHGLSRFERLARCFTHGTGFLTRYTTAVWFTRLACTRYVWLLHTRTHVYTPRTVAGYVHYVTFYCAGSGLRWLRLRDTHHVTPLHTCCLRLGSRTVAHVYTFAVTARYRLHFTHWFVRVVGYRLRYGLPHVPTVTHVVRYVWLRTTRFTRLRFPVATHTHALPLRFTFVHLLFTTRTAHITHTHTVTVLVTHVGYVRLRLRFTHGCTHTFTRLGSPRLRLGSHHTHTFTVPHVTGLVYTRAFCVGWFTRYRLHTRLVGSRYTVHHTTFTVTFTHAHCHARFTRHTRYGYTRLRLVTVATFGWLRLHVTRYTPLWFTGCVPHGYVTFTRSPQHHTLGLRLRCRYTVTVYTFVPVACWFTFTDYVYTRLIVALRLRYVTHVWFTLVTPLWIYFTTLRVGLRYVLRHLRLRFTFTLRCTVGYSSLYGYVVPLHGYGYYVAVYALACYCHTVCWLFWLRWIPGYVHTVTRYYVYVGYLLLRLRLVYRALVPVYVGLPHHVWFSARCTLFALLRLHTRCRLHCVTRSTLHHPGSRWLLVLPILGGYIRLVTRWGSYTTRLACYTHSSHLFTFPGHTLIVSWIMVTHATLHTRLLPNCVAFCCHCRLLFLVTLRCLAFDTLVYHARMRRVCVSFNARFARVARCRLFFVRTHTVLLRSPFAVTCFFVLRSHAFALFYTLRTRLRLVTQARVLHRCCRLLRCGARTAFGSFLYRLVPFCLHFAWLRYTPFFVTGLLCLRCISRLVTYV